ncbi:MAG: hypothetical protein QOK25_275 [Thermoleophilaceae bacterium]|jgi:hypothetical protein|nr:hypothetical protein [Thermoleophilaceae bacterium]
MRIKNIITGAVLCVALFAAAPAYAQTASQNAYSHPAGSVQQQLSDRTHHEPVVSEKESGKLPFTGLDIALVVAAGGVLLAMGFGIRRLSRPEVA